MAEQLVSVLFLCTGNSARSIIAEALLNRWGNGRFRAYSAGSHPKGAVHPQTLDLLRRVGLPVEGLRSKSWDEFAAPGAPAIDLVITVCDQAAGEVCPVWPGRPATAHWSFPDPAAYQGPAAEQRAMFADVLRQIERRIRGFCALSVTASDRSALQQAAHALATRQAESAG
ncbi:MAG: arsenate reductase ArsC [Rhodospirillales bacterium]|nr:arsenate reductase ArsC [Rhodospirillales bacterium]